MKMQFLPIALATALLAVRASAGDQPKPADANTAFALDLYQRLASSPPRANLFYSPYSISTALAMTYCGARGQTAQEMATTLHFDHAQAEVPAAFSALEQHLAAIGKEGKVTLYTANSLWYQKDYHFLPEFLETGRKAFGAEITGVNFEDQAEAARLQINQWVAGKTANKITDLLSPGILPPRTRIVLCNAIYFKGNWARQFQEKATRPGNFFLTPDQKVKVPMMSQRTGVRAVNPGGFHVLELPYQGGDLSMVILLPEAKDGLEALEKGLNGTNFLSWMTKLDGARPMEADVEMPKFKMSAQFGLAQTLGAMGMPSAFDKRADFSGMDGTHKLFISAVVHEAVVEVNEQGTEAAAATAVVGVMKVMAPPPVPVFRMDHPFIFLIRDRQTGSILFLGRMINPAK
jgi:serpin B